MVNAHIHTPYSFSAFGSIPEALDKAAAEGVRIVGINDFYSTEGFREWHDGCAERALYPLYGIELIALDPGMQASGRRVNDPGNPGRIYLSGKGLAYPPKPNKEVAVELARLRREANAQIARMCEKLNGYLRSEGLGVQLDYEQIKSSLTCGLVRERHLAKALRMALYPDADNPAALENDLRSRLLKAGGPAFVPEEPTAFLPVKGVQDIIEAAGGLVTYPFLGDNAKGGFTDFEEDLQKAADQLRALGIRSAEFITTRNSTAVLEQYSAYLEDEGFTVSFGSEHNTPAMEPLLLRTRDSDALSDKLQAVNYRGACAIAAHQAGLRLPREAMLEEGDKLIQKVLSA
ncbi:MAG: hypothetical protein J5640_05050 [Bacteroidales bacterium]|nr:hypothetical protein [Bacteroidales bacterium]